MLKKQKRKHRDHRRRADDGDKPFQLRAHPLSGMPPDVIKAAMLALAAREAEDFPKHLGTVTQLLKRKYPPLLIAIVAAYSLQAGVTDDGEIDSFADGMLQHHIEVMQALALALPEAEWGAEPATGEDVQLSMDTLKSLTDAFHHRRFSALEGEKDDQARAVLALQEKLRLHTQAVRNWGSFSQVVRISGELYAPLDAPLREAMGFSATELINVAHRMVKLLEERTNVRFRWMSRVAREHKPRKIVQAYYKYHPTAQGDPEEFLKLVPPGATRENVLAVLMQHADLLVQDDMMFDPAELAAQTGVSAEAITRILIALAKRPGELAGGNPERFFMANPTWESPVIILGDKFFCAMPQAIFSQIHRIMHRIATEAAILPQLEVRRPRYLEEKVARVLGAAFPKEDIRNGVKWRVGSVEYETDHLLLIDKVVLIVEDKSHSLTERGLRGAPERVREHVRDLIASPSEQSARLEGVILRANSGDPDMQATLMPFGLDFTRVERIIRLNVTLDDLTILSLEEAELKAAGWISNDLQLAPTMTLADLEAVIDILERPSYLLHYFAERQRIQTEGRVMADEIDLLGVYLKTGLNMGDLEEQKLEVTLTGASAPVDKYYNAGDAGVALPKPRPTLSSYYARLIASMEDKAFSGWSLATSDLLRSAVFEEQLKIEKALAKLKANVARDRDNPLRECSLVIRSHPLQKTALIFVAYPPGLAAQRRDIAGNMAGQVLNNTPDIDRCVVITRDISRWDEPYASVLFMLRPKVPDA